MHPTNLHHLRRGAKDAIPIALGYLAVSFTLGIAAKQAGLTAFQATFMSLTNNTSAGEVAGIGLIAAGATYLEVAFTQLIINLRYLLMSCALSQKLEPGTPTLHRLLMGYDISDEIFGLSIGVTGRLSAFYTIGMIVISAPCWALGTCLGVVVGNILPARVLSALSVALYAMFVAVVIPPARKSKVLAAVVALSMAASLLFDLIPFLGGISSGTKIILLTVLIAGAAAVFFPVKDEEQEGEAHGA